MRIACIIPTYNGQAELKRLLDSMTSQTVQCDVFIVDSGSIDGTFELAKSRVEHVTVISSAEFNHGGTRQLMVDQNPNYEAYVFLTQDACFSDSYSLERILEPFKDPAVGAVCGRQLPHQDASLFAQHARFFNYPEVVEFKALADVSRLGIRTAFMSNSFAAYRGLALEEVGGFPAHVIFAEDMYVAAKMLLADWKVVYSGHAQCLHSHNYSMIQEFERYFDMGVFHAREPWIRHYFGGAGGEGIRYVKSELRFIGLRRFYLWPVLILRNVFKLLGWKLGQQEARLPIGLKRKLGMNKRYWDGPNAVAKRVPGV